MSWIMMAAVLASSPAPRVSQVPETAAAETIAAELRTGTLIVTRGDCLAVKVFSVSPYTHVAAVVIRHGEPFIYDSTNGAGVRCQTLKNFLTSQCPAEVHLFQPQRSFSEKRAREFEIHLDSQLGRPYAIRHHLTGERADGLHCAEYVTDGLIACNLLQAKQPARVSPASLVEGLTTAELYTHAATLQLTPPPTVHPANASWCSRTWSDTKTCTRDCYLKMRGWFCCK